MISQIFRKWGGSTSWGNLARLFVVALCLAHSPAWAGDLCKSVGLQPVPKKPGEPASLDNKIAGTAVKRVIGRIAPTASDLYKKGQSLLEAPNRARELCGIVEQYQDCVEGGGTDCARGARQGAICQASEWLGLDNNSPLAIFGAIGKTTPAGSVYAFSDPVAMLSQHVFGDLNVFCLDENSSVFDNLHCCASRDDNGQFGGCQTPLSSTHAACTPTTSQDDPLVGTYFGPALAPSNPPVPICSPYAECVSDQDNVLRYIGDDMSKAHEKLTEALFGLVDQVVAGGGSPITNAAGVCGPSEMFDLLAMTGCEASAQLLREAPPHYAKGSEKTPSGRNPSIWDVAYADRTGELRDSAAMKRLVSIAALRTMAALPDVHLRFAKYASLTHHEDLQAEEFALDTQSPGGYSGEQELSKFLGACSLEALKRIGGNHPSVPAFRALALPPDGTPAETPDNARNMCIASPTPQLKTAALVKNPHRQTSAEASRDVKVARIRIDLGAAYEDTALLRVDWRLRDLPRGNPIPEDDVRVVFPVSESTMELEFEIDAASARERGGAAVLWLVGQNGRVERQVVEFNRL